MWPIVPTFTYGFVRSNFSFAISTLLRRDAASNLSSHHLPACLHPQDATSHVSTNESIVLIQLLKPVPQGRADLFNLRQIKLAQQGLVGKRQPLVQLRRILRRFTIEHSLANHALEISNADPLAVHL